MAHPETSGGQTRLRKFDVLSSTPAAGAAGSADTNPASTAAGGAAAAPVTAGGISAFLSSRYDMPITSLIVSCASTDTSSRLEGFDREGQEPGAQSGTLALALAAQLVPGWRPLTLAPFWRWQLQVRAAPTAPRVPMHYCAACGCLGMPASQGCQTWTPGTALKRGLSFRPLHHSRCWSLPASACQASAATRPPVQPGRRSRCSCASTQTTAGEGPGCTGCTGVQPFPQQSSH